MSFWAMFASPMLMSNDLRSIQPWAKDILLNKEVCEVHFRLVHCMLSSSAAVVSPPSIVAQPPDATGRRGSLR